jgi:pyrimidine operon attenuation protein/uracil phosphoribosyltransferase
VLPSMIWIGSLMNDSASLQWPSQATLFCAEDRCHRSLPLRALWADYIAAALGRKKTHYLSLTEALG